MLTQKESCLVLYVDQKIKAKAQENNYGVRGGPAEVRKKV